MADVTIIGAGLAGLQLARLLARGGAKVLLVDARRSVTDCVRTTGIFVRRTIDDFPILHPFLGPSIRTIGVHSPAGRTIELTSPSDEFRVGRMKPMLEAMLQQAIAAGVTWSPSTRYPDCEPAGLLVGADGARSRVARDLGLDQNTRFISGVEEVYPSSGATPRFDVWIDSRIAPGYLAWYVDDGEEIHLGVGGQRVSALRAFKERFNLPATPIETRGGLIPVNGVLRRIGNQRACASPRTPQT